MVSDARRPGLPSGFDAILEQGFGVSPKPALRRAEAADLVRRKVQSAEIPCQRMRISELPVDRDTLFDMTGRRVKFPEGARYDRCYVALVDPEVAAPWGHPASWAFVPVDGQGEVAVSSTEFPENAKGSIRFIEVPP